MTPPDSIQAIVLTEHGGPDVLHSARVPLPSPGPGQVRVRTGAVGVNFIETYQRAGIYPVQLPFTPGMEAAGTVEAVGEGVTGLSVGDRVTTTETEATYAEAFVVDAERAVVIPASVDIQTAAAVSLQGVTAHYLSTSSYPARSGEVALVHAGAGGVGLLLTQLLATAGVTVITTTSTPKKAALSRAAGAQHTIGYDAFATRVRELTGGRGVDVVYDGVGKDTFDGSLASLRIRGTFVLFGGASGQVPPFNLQRLNTAGSITITRPTSTHFLLNRAEREWRYRELFEAIEAGTLAVRIGATFPLAEAAAAHRALEGRGTTGKTLLIPGRR
ncbi:quinone oxidoreductase [Klugiella xanthotipulae]|uniref:NADPH2:quinone reductase n=1 Tax=Klugiella xanthotipulae TaxID=244735 RepID=A0A543HH35_9MICO|nr:quinone oxidoreductase [Klugiella xanthotipulae]TQM57631.1 NADPH2:quinone reductase [Klugiella xanthotipulae]